MPGSGRYVVGGLIVAALAGGGLVLLSRAGSPPREPPRTQIAPLTTAAPPGPTPTEFAGTDEEVAELLREIDEARVQAAAEALKANPESDGGGDALSGPALDPERQRRQQAKRDALARAIEEKYRRAIAHRHGLSLEQLDRVEAQARAAR